MPRLTDSIRKFLIAFLLPASLGGAVLLAQAGAQSGPDGKSAAPAKKTAAAAKSAGKTSAVAAEADWTELRGPNRDNTSPEKNLPEKWSLQGENLLWRAPYGGISGPVTFGDRVYLLRPAGKGPEEQERVTALDANTGKLVWEFAINLSNSDVPPHRAAWSSPTVDPATGNVFVFGVSGNLVALSPAGKPLWQRNLTEEFGLITTHGGRTVSPLIDGETVLVSGITFNWGDLAGGSHRFYAFDKKSGDLIWVSSPGGRPYDTTYAPVIVTEASGMRQYIVGAADGAYYGLKAGTGEKVWSYLTSKRGINTGAIVVNGMAILTHSEENFPTNEMGFLAAVSTAATGTLADKDAKWIHYGFLGGFSNPVSDGQRIYQIDNGALLAAFDLNTGKEIWQKKIGTIQKATPALAEGKLYTGTEDGRFFILRLRPDGCDVLSEVQLGTETQPEAIRGNAAIARGRIYVTSSDATYAIGRKGSRVAPGKPAQVTPAATVAGEPSLVQVVPADVATMPGKTTKFRARLFDAKGNLIREAADAQWSAEQVDGSFASNAFTAKPAPKGQAGKVIAKVGGLSGAARVRIIQPLPWTEDFSSYDVGKAPVSWVNTSIKYAVKELDGNKVLTKLADNQFSFIKRARAYAGLHDWSDYTVEADIRAATRRRQMGDGGVVAQGYSLVLFGNSGKLELQSWQPETQRTKVADYAWSADTWYHLKLRVENLPDGRVRAQGKVWKDGEAEPAAWTLERVDPPGFGLKHGAPGLYGDAPFEVYFDNFKVTPNK